MSDRFFLDTNIFVYSLDLNSPAKAKVAQALVRRAVDTGKGAISYQVVQEFFNVVLRKFAEPMSPADAEQYLAITFRQLLSVYFSAALCGEALRLYGQYRLSWYDALIVAAAIEAECAVLYSEDLQDGRTFGSLRVKNPFSGL